MTPKEKAEYLFKEYYSYLKANLMNDKEAWEDAKVCALMAVDEIINVVKRYETKKGRLLIDNINLLYWQEVKQEIEKL